MMESRTPCQKILSSDKGTSKDIMITEATKNNVLTCVSFVPERGGWVWEITAAA